MTKIIANNFKALHTRLKSNALASTSMDNLKAILKTDKNKQTNKQN